MRYRSLLTAIVIIFLVAFACADNDDGTLDDSLDNPDATDDDTDNPNPPPSDTDDDDDSGDDDSGDDDDDDDDTPFEGDLLELFISPELAVEPAGFPVQYLASGRDEYGNDVSNVPVDWSSADTSIATIDADGLAMTVANGKTEITGTWENPGNGNTLTASVELWVMGDVLVLGADSRLALLDISDGSSQNNYLQETLSGQANSLTLVHDQFGVLVMEDALSYVGAYNLDPDAIGMVAEVNLPMNHVGTASIENEGSVYIVEPSTHSLSLFHPLLEAWENSFMGGLILLADGAWPSAIGSNNDFLLALGSRTEPGSGVYNEGNLYFIRKSGAAMNAIAGISPVEWPNPIKVGGAAGYAFVLSAGDDTKAGSRLDIYEGQNHLSAKNIAGKMSTMAVTDGGNVWIGDGEAPHLYAFSLVDNEWILPPAAPLELPAGDRVVALQVNDDRNEVWAANEDGDVYGIDTIEQEVVYTFALDGFNVTDVDIW